VPTGAQRQRSAERDDNAGHIAGMPHRGVRASVDHSLTAFRVEADHRLEELIDRFGPK